MLQEAQVLADGSGVVFPSALRVRLVAPKIVPARARSVEVVLAELPINIGSFELLIFFGISEARFAFVSPCGRDGARFQQRRYGHRHYK